MNNIFTWLGRKKIHFDCTTNLNLNYMHKIYCSISLSLNDFLNNRGKNAREKCWQSFMTHSVSFSSFLSSYRISYSLREVKISFRVHCTITHQTSPLNIFPRQNNPEDHSFKAKACVHKHRIDGSLAKTVIYYFSSVQVFAHLEYTTSLPRIVSYGWNVSTTMKIRTFAPSIC